MVYSPGLGRLHQGWLQGSLGTSQSLYQEVHLCNAVTDVYSETMGVGIGEQWRRGTGVMDKSGTREQGQ